MVAWSFGIIQPLFNRIVVVYHKVIIFISLENSCVHHLNVRMFFLFPILLSSYLDFCEKCLKKTIKKF